MSSVQSQISQIRHDGQLSMTFEERGPKTVLTDTYQVPPLKASRSLYINPDNPSEATVYMMESSGGLVEGDHNRFEVNVKEGAEACLIPQSATIIYPSYNGIWSKQDIDVSIESKARLAWKTEAVIPFEKAKFHGQTVINMKEDSTLLWGEILSPGRDKRGEKFEYSDVKTNFQVWMDGECLIYDPLLFSPDETNLKQMGLLEENLYIGSLWFVHPNLKDMDIRELNERLQRFENIKVSASLLEGKAVNVRWLVSDMVLLKKEMNNIWEEFMRFMK